MNNDTIGNLTTIIKFIVMTIAPYLSLTEALQNQLVAVIVALIGFILAYYDAKYQNNIITKDTTTINPNDVDDVIDDNVDDDGA